MFCYNEIFKYIEEVVLKIVGLRISLYEISLCFRFFEGKYLQLN